MGIRGLCLFDKSWKGEKEVQVKKRRGGRHRNGDLVQVESVGNEEKQRQVDVEIILER